MLSLAKSRHGTGDISGFGQKRRNYLYLLAAAAALSAPLVLSNFYLGELSMVFIYGLISIAMMILVGFTGQVSLAHAAFLGIGAYAHVYFLNLGVPFLFSVVLSASLTAIVGFAVGLPALRMSGIYLAIATLAFSEIALQVFTHWKSVTNGINGIAVPEAVIFGFAIDTDARFYFLCLAALAGVTVVARNLVRSSTGRAWTAIRDSEIAAQSMGVNLAIYKTLSFAVSAFLTGIGGALFAHKIGYLSPDIFTLVLAIQLLVAVVVGGLGSLQGAFVGAAFIAALPVAIAIARDYLPNSITRLPGLESGLFGLILVAVILFEPEGLFGRWRKLKAYISEFPMHRRMSFRRQKSYSVSERLR